MKRGLVSRRSITSNDPRLVEYLSYVGENSGKGVNVNSGDMAMKIAAVYRSISILSGTIASLPRYPRRKTKGNFEIDYKNPLYNLLRWKTSERLNADEFSEFSNSDFDVWKLLRFFQNKNGEYSELVLLTQRNCELR